MKIRRLKTILRQRGYTAQPGKEIYIWMHHSVLTVHDEIVLECPDAQIEEATQILKDAMVQACREYLKVVHMLTATIQFCGAGGTSEGAQQAGIHIEAAINHSKTAIATHEANHKGCKHFQQDITEINPDNVPDSDMLLTSPECTNHSDSKGQKHYHQFDLFGDIVFDPLDEKSRNTMEDVVRFAKAKLTAGKPYKCIVVENVVEVVKWRKYAPWLASLIALGYQYQALYWNTQFFGVSQSRDRVYLVFWLRDLPAPDLDFHPTAFCEDCEREIQAVQAWKTLLKWGSDREQYVYRCLCCASEVTPFFTLVASVLNLDEPGDPLFQRTSGRILKKKTIDGVRKGIERFQGRPFLYAYYKNRSIGV